jgi:hypothetical protein
MGRFVCISNGFAHRQQKKKDEAEKHGSWYLECTKYIASCISCSWPDYGRHQIMSINNGKEHDPLSINIVPGAKLTPELTPKLTATEHHH